MHLAAWAAVSFAGWSSMYGCLCWLNSARGSEWNCRVVTALHGILSFSVAFWSAFISGPFPLSFDVVGTENVLLQEVTMIICFGYFVFDFIWCLAMQTEGPLMLLHHVTCIVGLIASMSWGTSGAEVVATAVGSEITNPFLQARWFLKQTGNYDSTQGRVVDTLFVLLFVFVRIGVGAALLYVALASPRPMLFFKAGGVAMYFISMVFLAQILQFAYRKVMGIKRPASASSTGTAAAVKPSTANGVLNNGVSRSNSSVHQRKT